MLTGALPLPDRVRLGHTAVDHIARNSGIRILHFKGPLAAELFPERPAGMGDVDIFVDPARAVELAVELERQGWISEGAISYPLSNHALVLTEVDSFHCTFDLHVRYPGIRISDEDAFELLWSSKMSATLCNRTLLVPSRSTHALLLLLESTRNYADHPQRQGRKISGVLNSLSTEEWENLREIARRTGAASALAATVPQIAGTQAATPSMDSPLSPASPVWKARVAETTGLSVWLARILDEPRWTRRSQIALMALLPQPEHGSPGPLSPLSQAWTIVSRWGRGLQQLLHLGRKSITYRRSIIGGLLNGRGGGIHKATAPETAAPQEATEAEHPGSLSDAAHPPAPASNPPSPATPANPPFAWLWTTGDALAILELRTREITILRGPSAPLWLAYRDPQVPDPINHVAQLYPDLPDDGLEQLRHAEQQLRDHGVLP